MSTATREHVPERATATIPDRADALTTGLLYLGMGVTGILGFLVIRPRLFAPGDPDTTVANLLTHGGLGRTGVALELALVLFQVLAALWFFRLFRAVDAFAAGAIAVFGTVNAVAQLGSAAFLASALEVADQPVGDGASHLLYVVSDSFWGVSNLFFGLWLLPMGVVVLRSGWPPRTLGWLLVAGGLGYVASAFATQLVPGDTAVLAGVLAVPATVAEFWMIGWLLRTGLRR